MTVLSGFTFGVDTSSAAGNRECDWNAVKAAGTGFVYLKKAQSMFGDAAYARDSDAARKAGLPVGAYVFPNTNINAQSPKTQVATWKKLRGDVIPKLDLPIALDVESKDWATTGQTKKAVIELLRQFVLELHDQYGAWPMIYTSYNQWYGLGLPSVTWGVKCPLWVKTAYHLPAHRPVDQDVPHVPHVGVDAAGDPRNYYRIPDPWADTGHAIQQWQGDAIGFPGMTKAVDMNRFNTLQQGSNDPFVRWVQRTERLKDDGDFGPLTDAAVRSVQVQARLPVTGVVDPSTFAFMAWSNT